MNTSWEKAATLTCWPGFLRSCRYWWLCSDAPPGLSVSWCDMLTWGRRWSQATSGGSGPCLMTMLLTVILQQTRIAPPWSQTRLQMTVVICNCPPCSDNRRYAGAQLLLDTGLVFARCAPHKETKSIFCYGNMSWVRVNRWDFARKLQVLLPVKLRQSWLGVFWKYLNFSKYSAISSFLPHFFLCKLIKASDWK